MTTEQRPQATQRQDQGSRWASCKSALFTITPKPSTRKENSPNFLQMTSERWLKHWSVETARQRQAIFGEAHLSGWLTRPPGSSSSAV